MLQEFKDFAMKGNIVDLAVAVVIGAAFGKIVTALVANIITSIVGAIMGGLDFSGLSINIGEAAITYGAFIQAVIDFAIVALVLFMVIKGINKMQKEEEPAEEEEKGPSEVELLTEIRDSLKR